MDQYAASPAGNQSALHALDSALFCLSLDETAAEDPSELSHVFLHGDGCNRWARR